MFSERGLYHLQCLLMNVNMDRSLTIVKILRNGTDSLSKQCKPDPEVIKNTSCSTQLSMKFFLLINVKMPTIVGIFTFMSRKNNILGLSELEKC